MMSATPITTRSRPNKGSRPDIGPVVVTKLEDLHCLASLGVDGVLAKDCDDPILSGLDCYSIWPTASDGQWLGGFESAIAVLTTIEAPSPREWLTEKRTADDIKALLITWPPLHKLDKPNLPRLSTDQLPSWAGKHADSLTHALEAPPELAIVCTLGAASLAAARRVQVEINPGYIEPCNLWLICALPPANRKTAAIDKAFAPVMSWESAEREAMKPEVIARRSLIDSQKARIGKLRKCSANEDEKEQRDKLISEIIELEQNMPETLRPTTLWTNDSTPEKLGSLMADDPDGCLAWVSDEGGLFDTMGGRYSGGTPNLDNMLKAHSQGQIRVNRGHRIDDVESPTLTVCLTPQPDVLKGLALKKGFSGRGLMERFIFFIPPSPIGYRTHKTIPMPLDVVEKYNNAIKKMLSWPRPLQGRHTITLSPEAREEWEEFRDTLEPLMRPFGQLYPLVGWAGKCAGQTARLAGILHCIELVDAEPWSAPIERGTMIKAIEIMAASSQHAIAIYELLGKNSEFLHSKHLWNWIERGQHEVFSLRDAHQSLRKTLSSNQLKEAALDLQERGYISLLDKPSGGGRRPSPLCRVRPDFIAKWRS